MPHHHLVFTKFDVFCGFAIYFEGIVFNGPNKKEFLWKGGQ